MARKSNMAFSATLRTPETESRYGDLKKQSGWNEPCPLCKAESIKVFKLWKLIRNDYPYDKVMRSHDMLVPLRHVPYDGISDDEWEEYEKLKKEVAEVDYQWIMEAMAGQSLPQHFHLHLVIAK